MTDKPYNRLLFVLNSDKFVPSNSNMTCIVNEHELSEDDLHQHNKSDIIHSYDCVETGRENHRLVEKHILIPILTPSKQFTNLLIKYPTQAFENALNNKEDYIESSTLHLTERMDIEIQLSGKFKENFRLVESNETDPRDGGKKAFEVMDNSSQRMDEREDELKKDNMIPVFTDSKVYWTIYHPKISYRYRLYFTIEKKEKSKTAKNVIEGIPLTRPLFVGLPKMEISE